MSRMNKEEAMQRLLDLRRYAGLGAVENEALEYAVKFMNDVSFFGMTVEAERRVMKNAVSLIREVVDDYVFGCDSGSDSWRDFFTGWSDELDEKVEQADYPSDFCYQLTSDTWLFKKLISWGTTRAGHGSACEECMKIGKVLGDDD